jgi:hypothetical protein
MSFVFPMLVLVRMAMFMLVFVAMAVIVGVFADCY